jgi:hypothetical protein
MDTIQIVLAFERPAKRGEAISYIDWAIYDEASRQIDSGTVEALGWSTSLGMLEVAISQVRRHLRPYLG